MDIQDLIDQYIYCDQTCVVEDLITTGAVELEQTLHILIEMIGPDGTNGLFQYADFESRKIALKRELKELHRGIDAINNELERADRLIKLGQPVIVYSNANCYWWGSYSYAPKRDEALIRAAKNWPEG